jgi:hypothetical protein
MLRLLLIPGTDLLTQPDPRSRMISLAPASPKIKARLDAIARGWLSHDCGTFVKIHAGHTICLTCLSDPIKINCFVDYRTDSVSEAESELAEDAYGGGAMDRIERCFAVTAITSVIVFVASLTCLVIF